jgi:hypothetical protein
MLLRLFGVLCDIGERRALVRPSSFRTISFLTNAPTSFRDCSSSRFWTDPLLQSFASHSFAPGVMNVSSDALNKKENKNKHARNDDQAGNCKPEDDESQQEVRKGSETEEDREGNQGEGLSIRKQGRESPGPDEAQGRRNPRGNREGDRLAESQHSRIRQRARDQEAGAEGRVDEERSRGADIPDFQLDQGRIHEKAAPKMGGFCRSCRLSAHVASWWRTVWRLATTSN